MNRTKIRLQYGGVRAPLHITRSWFETALNYKLRILRLRKVSYNINLVRFSTTHQTLIYKLEIAIRIFSNLVSMLQNVFGIGYKPVKSKNSKSNHSLQVSEVHYQNHRWHCIILFTGISKLTANYLLLNSSNLYFIKVCTKFISTYTVYCIVRNLMETRENIKIVSHNLWLIFIGIKQKINFWKINSKMANSQNFLVKITWICPWVSRIDWWEGYWCSSTYMVERLFNVSSKTGKI